MFRSILFLIPLIFVTFLLACAPPAPPAPTPDLQATTTQIAANIFATQTASVPTITLTPSVTPLPSATPTETLLPFHETNTAVFATLIALPSRTASLTPPPATAQALRAIQTGTAIANATAQIRACIHDTNLVPDNWRVLFCDPFDSSVKRWVTGSINDDYAQGTRAIVDDKYRWELTAKKDVVYRAIAPTDTYADAYVSVVAQLVSGTNDDSFALFVRLDSSGNYYYFQVRNDQYFHISMRYNNAWTSLTGWIRSANIRPDEPNRLTIKAEGPLLLFYINDKQVLELRDTRLSIGRAGVAVELSASDSAVFEFDDFELRAP